MRCNISGQKVSQQAGQFIINILKLRFLLASAIVVLSTNIEFFLYFEFGFIFIFSHFNNFVRCFYFFQFIFIEIVLFSFDFSL